MVQYRGLTHFAGVGLTFVLLVVLGLVAPVPPAAQPSVEDFLAGSAGAASVDYFLKIPGVDGESTDDKHKNEIDILSWSWGELEPGIMFEGGAGRGGAGKANVQDFHFTMHVNKASPKLMEACASGRHFDEVKLSVQRTGENPQDYLTLKLQDCRCTSYQIGAPSETGDVVPVDQISLNFSKVEFEYFPQGEDGTLGGSVKATWDVQKNTSEVTEDEDTRGEE